MLLIAAVAFSVFAVLPIHLAHCEDDDPFQYSYPIVHDPDFAYVGELAPGASTPWVTVTVTFTGPATLPVTSIGPWQAQVTDSHGTVWDWVVTAIPGPAYNWPTATSTVVVDIKVTVPADWTEECDHTFNVKLLGGKDSKTPTPRTISPGEGVHFKVCIKIPPQHHFTLECESFMTDSSFNRITSFDTVWTPRDPKGRDYYKLSSTNPGQFMFNIWIHNTGDIDAESLTVTYTIPGDFILKGADPIQVWTGYGKTGTRIWTVTIVGNTMTINSGLAAGAELWITFHLEYGPARDTFPASIALNWKTTHPFYTFSDLCHAEATGYDPVELYQYTDLFDPTVVLGVED